MNAGFTAGTRWIITRSTTLQSGSFTEIFRFDGTAYTFNSAQVLVVDNGDTITIIDRLPPPGKAFYRFAPPRHKRKPRHQSQSPQGAADSVRRAHLRPMRRAKIHDSIHRRFGPSTE